MNNLRYGSFVCMNEIKPKFPPKVQQIWDDCGTHVTSVEAEQGAKEIEFFVRKLVLAILEDCQYDVSGDDVVGILHKRGYT